MPKKKSAREKAGKKVPRSFARREALQQRSNAQRGWLDWTISHPGAMEAAPLLA